MKTIFVVAITIFVFLSSCSQQSDHTDSRSECFSIFSEKRLGGTLIKVVENNFSGKKFDRCRALFDLFSKVNPTESKRHFYVVESVADFDFFLRASKLCPATISESAIFRKRISSVLNQCLSFAEEILFDSRYPEARFGKFYPSNYLERDLSHIYRSVPVPEQAYASAGLIEEKNEKIMPICVYDGAILVDGSASLKEHLNAHADFLEGCLFQYIDR